MLERERGIHVREMQRVPELVQQRPPVGLSAVRTEDEIDLVRNRDRRAEGAGALAARSPVS